MTKNKNINLQLSIIVPVYNAEKYIYENLLELHKMLVKSKKTFEIICVVDGASDKSEENARKAAKKYIEIKVYSYKINYGKGYAVRYGMKKAKGRVIGFIDAGWDLDYEDILRFLDIMKKQKADIVIGSKRHPESIVHYPNFRKIFSLGYQFYVKSLFGLSVNDTQVGMKIFKKKIIDQVLPTLKIDGFAFDIEILSISQKLLNAKIVEAPIRVILDENFSTIKIKGGFLINSIKVFWDTLSIFYGLRIKKVYNKQIS